MTDRWGPALYVLLCLIWGSTWLVIKVGYGGLGPFNVAGLRFLIAGALMAVVAQATGVRWPRGRPEWTAVGVVGLLMFAGDYGLIYWAEQYIESGLTAVLFATLPLMTLFIARAYLPGDRITTGKLASSLLALVGTVALFADRLQLDSDAVGPMLGVLGATLCAAVDNAQRGGTNIVLLTRLGGGAFGNDDAWIDAAMRRALHEAAAMDLDVRLVNHGPPSRTLLRLAADFGSR